MSKVEESQNVRRFIKYVVLRCKYIESDILQVSDNEYKYHKALLEQIKAWGSQHKLYYAYLLNKLSIELLKCFLGIKERNVFRYLERQRKCLIDFIQTKENELFLQYPFFDIPRKTFEKEIIL